MRIVVLCKNRAHKKKLPMKIFENFHQWNKSVRDIVQLKKYPWNEISTLEKSLAIARGRGNKKLYGLGVTFFFFEGAGVLLFSIIQ